MPEQSVYSYPTLAQIITKSDITLREILDTYREDNDLLKLILVAKAQEDKRRAEEERCKAERFRLQHKQVDLEMLREQKKIPTIFTGAPSIINNTSSTTTNNFNVKSPSDTIPQQLDSHFSNASATITCLSPPRSVNNYNNNNLAHNHISSSYDNNNTDNIAGSSAAITTNQRPSLTLSIPSFSTISSSPTVMNNHQPFSIPNSGIEYSHHSASPLNHYHYLQTPTSAISNKRTDNNNEVDHEYVMEALRAKVQRNQEDNHYAKKFMNVLKPRNASISNHHHHNNDNNSNNNNDGGDGDNGNDNQQQIKQESSSPVDPQFNSSGLDSKS